MKKLKVLLLSLLLFSLLLGFTASSVKASSEKATPHSESTKEVKALESEKVKEEGHENVKTEESKEEGHEGLESKEEGHGEEEGAHEEGGEHEPEDFRLITGWQTPFTILAILFFVGISLNLLPKLAAKDLGGHHD